MNKEKSLQREKIGPGAQCLSSVQITVSQKTALARKRHRNLEWKGKYILKKKKLSLELNHNIG